MKQRKTILIVDSNNIYNKIWAVQNRETKSLSLKGVGLRTSTNINTSLVYGLLRVLNAFCNHHTVNATILCNDIGGSVYRKTLFPYYKANREKRDDYKVFTEEMRKARGIMEQLGFAVFNRQGIEADDQIGFYANWFKDLGWDVIVLSDDKDMYQLMRKHIKIWRHCKQKFATVEDCRAEYRCKPKQIPYVMGLMGQQKDNIPGLCPLKDGIMQKIGFGIAKAEIVLKAFIEGQLEFKDCMVTYLSEKETDKWYNYIVDNYKQIKMSIKLSRIRMKDKLYNDDELLQLDSLLGGDEDTLIQTPVHRATVLQIQKMLEIKSIKVVEVINKCGVKVI